MKELVCLHIEYCLGKKVKVIQSCPTLCCLTLSLLSVRLCSPFHSWLSVRLFLCCPSDSLLSVGLFALRPTLSLLSIRLFAVWFCDPMDYSVHGNLQARILEWVIFPFSRGSSQPRDWTQVSHIAGGFFTSWATKETWDYWSR